MIESAYIDFMRSRRAAGRSPRTIAWYQVQLGAWLRWLAARPDASPDDWLSPEILEEYLEHERDRGLSDRSIESYWRALRAFLSWIKKRRPALLAGRPLPTEAVERPHAGIKRPRVASYESVCKLIRSIQPATWLDFRDRAIIQLFLSTGLRVEEAINLRINHVETKDRFVMVDSGKGDKDRIVPYDTDFQLAFTGYVYNRPVGFDGWLFVGSNALYQPVGQMTTNAVRKMLIRRCADVGLTYINPHSIRHLFATKALNDGVQLSAVSAMLGHSSPSFTAKVYAKWLKAGLRREYDQHWQTR